MIPRLGSWLTAFFLCLAFILGCNGSKVAEEKGKTADPKERTLSLTTGYLFDAVLQDKSRAAHEITLTVTLEGKGTGKGTMELDPNAARLNEFGDVVGRTEIATQSISIPLKQIKKEDSRHPYEIEEQPWSLVVGAGATGHRLLSKDKEGKIPRTLPLQVVTWWKLKPRAANSPRPTSNPSA